MSTMFWFAVPLLRRTRWESRGLLACLLLGTFFSSVTIAAPTLGQITAIERAPNVVYISGERFAVTAEATLVEIPPEGGDQVVITWRSLNVGDYVLFESDGAVLKYLQRVAPDGIDAPPASPLQFPGESGSQ
jgi:hypothetical protein